MVKQRHLVKRRTPPQIAIINVRSGLKKMESLARLLQPEITNEPIYLRIMTLRLK